MRPESDRPLKIKVLAAALTASLALVAPLLTPGVATTVKADNSSNGKVKISSDLKKRGGATVSFWATSRLWRAPTKKEPVVNPEEKEVV